MMVRAHEPLGNKRS